MRTAIQIYALTVCFFTMACLAITTGLALWNGLKVAVPTMTLSSGEYRAHQSDQNYLEHLSTKYSYKIKNDEYTLPDIEQIAVVREKAYSELVDSERHGALSNHFYSS